MLWLRMPARGVVGLFALGAVAPSPRPYVPRYALQVRLAPDSAFIAVEGSFTLPPTDSARDS